MGVLAKALSRPSSYSVKRDHPELWADIVDRINGAILAVELDELETWLEFHELEVPAGWDRSIAELIANRREDMAGEDIGEILIGKFDF